MSRILVVLADPVVVREVKSGFRGLRWWSSVRACDKDSPVMPLTMMTGNGRERRQIHQLSSDPMICFVGMKHMVDVDSDTLVYHLRASNSMSYVMLHPVVA